MAKRGVWCDSGDMAMTDVVSGIQESRRKWYEVEDKPRYRFRDRQFTRQHQTIDNSKDHMELGEAFAAGAKRRKVISRRKKENLESSPFYPSLPRSRNYCHPSYTTAPLPATVMLQLLRNAQLYTPEWVGMRDLLVGGEQILWIGIGLPPLPPEIDVVERDLAGRRVLPG